MVASDAVPVVRRYDLVDAAATERLGAAIAAAFDGAVRGVILLRGDLGAGKTTLARGCLRAFGVPGTIKSPTYTLFEPYAVGRTQVLHMDLYRLADPDELWQLGLDAYPPEEALWLVEWPERAGGGLPAAVLEVELRHCGARREACLRGDGRLLDRIESAAGFKSKEVC